MKKSSRVKTPEETAMDAAHRDWIAVLNSAAYKKWAREQGEQYWLETTISFDSQFMAQSISDFKAGKAVDVGVRGECSHWSTAAIPVGPDGAFLRCRRCGKRCAHGLISERVWFDAA